MRTPGLDIVIVNWNSGELLKASLTSIAASKQDGFRLSKVIIVDNASSDNSLEGLERLGLPIEIIRNSSNLGFAAAVNKGTRAGSGDYLLLFNPDALLAEETISTVIAFMERPQNKKVGICGVKLLEDNGHISPGACAYFPTLSTYLGKATGLSRALPGLFPKQFVGAGELVSSKIVDHVCGAFYMVRRSLFERLNGLDERFFVYLEDLDFSLRAKKSGYVTYYLSEVSAYHSGGGVSKKVKATRLFYSLRSRILYARKHFSRLDAMLLVALTVTVEPVARVTLALAKGSFAETIDTLKGYRKLFGFLLGFDKR